MPKMNSKNILLALLGISVLLIFFRFSTLIAFPESRTLDKGEIQKIYPGQTFSQKFIANRDNLDELQILIRTPGPKDGDIMTAKLADETCANIQAEGNLEKPFLNTDNVYLFKFPRIADSKDKKYCLLLSYRSGSDSTKYLRFFTIPEEDKSMLLMNTATNSPLNGEALSMRTVYRNATLWQDLNELNDRISQYKPWFLKDFFIGTIAILFVLLSIAMIVMLIHMKPEEKE